MGEIGGRPKRDGAGFTAREAVAVLGGLVALMLVAVAPGAAEAQDRPPIKVAIEGAYPPFNYLDQNNEPQGFEVDLLKALCETMRTECILVTHEWDGIIRGLLNHEYDAIVSSLEINDRRAKRIAFSRRYYLIPAAFIAASAEPITDPTPEALADKTIGAVDRSEHARFIEERYPRSKVQTYAKLEEANLDLLTGRVDFVIGDKLSLAKFLESREGACCRFVADAPVDPAFRGYGVGLRKEDEELKARFDAAIGEVMANGTYDRIRAKYFPFDIK